VQAPRIATAGQSIGITLDRDIFVERGDVVSLPTSPATAAKRLRARVFWLHPRPLAVGGQITVRIGTAAADGVVSAIEDAVDPGLLASDGAGVIGENHVGEIEIELSQALAADPYTVDPNTGRVVLEFDRRIAGGGLVLTVHPADADAASGHRATVPAPARPSASGSNADELRAKAVALARVFRGLSPAERIAHLRREVAGKIVFTTSFGLEDQAILHLLAQQNDGIDVVTLDTGRLFPETYALWAQSERYYGRRIRAIYPRQDELAALVQRHGINGFYESRAARIACCSVRKLEPLGRALAGARAWIAGLRWQSCSTL
jgi:hypothetical protein